MPLGEVADIQQINTPTEVDHYQIRRVIDIYVATQDRGAADRGRTHQPPAGHNAARPQHALTVRGAVVNMNQAFHDFGIGLIIAILWSTSF